MVAARHTMEEADLAASLLEIVEIANGEFVLQRAGGEGGPLVNIRFSDESRQYLADARLEIAKAMIQAMRSSILSAARTTRITSCTRSLRPVLPRRLPWPAALRCRA